MLGTYEPPEFSRIHLSRHFLGTQPTCLGNVPFPPAGPEDDDGCSETSTIICHPGWNEDSNVRA